MANTDIKNEDHRLWLCLYQTADVIQKLRNRELSQIGLSMLESTVLSWIEKSNRAVTDSELARWMQRDIEPTRTVLRRMRAKDLINMERGFKESDTVTVCMTLKGQIAYEDSLRQEYGCQAISSLSNTEKAQLDILLKKVTEASNNNLSVR